jgi:hypothetical protein
MTRDEAAIKIVSAAGRKTDIEFDDLPAIEIFNACRGETLRERDVRRDRK